MGRVGKSVFYDCLEISPTAEKQDFMKPEQSDTDEESKFICVCLFVDMIQSCIDDSIISTINTIPCDLFPLRSCFVLLFRFSFSRECY